MLKTEHFHGDEIEVSVSSREWMPAKEINFHKDGFYQNIIKMMVTADCVVKPEDTKGYLGFFINNEEKPRAVIESDLPYSYPLRTEFDITDLPFGKHKLVIKMKSDNGYPVTNRFLEIYITRFFNVYEIVGYAVPFLMWGAT